MDNRILPIFKIRKNCPCYLYLFATYNKITITKRYKKCTRKCRGCLKETMKVMLIRTQLLSKEIKVTIRLYIKEKDTEMLNIKQFVQIFVRIH